MDCVVSQKNIYDLQKIFLWMRKICHLIKASLFLKTGNAFDQVQVAESKETGVTDVEDALGRYGDSILRLAYSYLHNMSDAEDILQETLIKYMEADRKFESDVHKKAWLLRVAANLSKNKIDYNRIRQTDELEDTLVMEEREDLSFVWDAVKKLPEKYLEVIHLFYYEGYQTKEISKILSRNESSVRSDLKRGRERLKDLLREAYDFEI